MRRRKDQYNLPNQFNRLMSMSYKSLIAGKSSAQANVTTIPRTLNRTTHGTLRRTLHHTKHPFDAWKLPASSLFLAQTNIPLSGLAKPRPDGIVDVRALLYFWLPFWQSFHRLLILYFAITCICFFTMPKLAASRLATRQAIDYLHCVL